MWYDITLMRSQICKGLSVKLLIPFDMGGEYPTVVKKPNAIRLHSNYLLKFDTGFEKPELTISNFNYYHFIVLLSKSLDAISSSFCEIFPDTNSKDFEMDEKTLQRFITEKGLRISGMSIEPAVYINDVDECFPAIKIITERGFMVVPYDDAMALLVALKSNAPILHQLMTIGCLGTN